MTASQPTYTTKAQGLHPIPALGVRAGRFEEVESDTLGEKKKKIAIGLHAFIPL